MRIVLFLTGLFLSFLSIQTKAEWIQLDKNRDTNTSPRSTIIRSDENSIEIKFEIFGFELKNLKADGSTFQNIDLLTEIFTNIAGSPELPYIAHVLAIPDMAGISVEVLETGPVFTFNNIQLPPSRTSWWEGDEESPFIKDSEVYQSSNPYPTVLASMDKPSVFRDFRISRLSVFPVQYFPEKSEIQVFSSITVKVKFDGKEVINPKTTPKRSISPSFAQLYRSFIFNYQDVLDKQYNGKEDGREVMLCIMPDVFVESFQVYADWKRQSGIDIHITTFSDIGATASNPNTIKNHITEAYQTWEHRPTYVLIVGDDGVFPKKIVTYPSYSFPWEEFFVTIEGDDYFPEMMIGRFTNQEDYRMQVMINKFMLYEKNPFTEDTSWFKKGICCSNNAYESQVETKRFAANIMLDYGQFTSVDTMMSNGTSWGSNCTYSLSHILSAINQGRSFLNYRGEGWSSGWYASCYNFSTSDVSNLNNGQKFTFVTSIGCGVAMFDTYGGNCFGEEWIQLGTLTNPRGGIGFIGPTSNTHTTYNNRIDKGIYVGMFQEGMDTPGQALTRGKLYMYNVFGHEYYVEYHYKVFCVLGDPSIHVWKDVPLEVNIEHPSTIPVGNNTVECIAYYTDSSLPVVNAIITITGDEVFATGYTDETGKAIIDVMPLLSENLTVTVRGKNVIPQQGTIEVSQPDELIEPSGLPEIDDVDGNHDGKINPNETCNISFTLKNWGDTMVGNVKAILSSEDSNIQILTVDPVSYGNIEPNEYTTGEPFQFFVKPNCPVNYIIPIKLNIVSNNNSWDYYYNLDVKGCELIYKNFVVFDTLSPNANFRMDPGETVALVLSVINSGEDIAPDVIGQLSCDDPNITVIDSFGSFGTLPINGDATNLEDSFIINIHEDCPTGYFAVFSLKLYTENGHYPYETTFSFSLPVSKLIPSDYTGPDQYGYYAYSSDDTFYDQKPKYKWVELVGVGNQIELPEQSDYTVTVNLPFPFKYYGNDYEQLRISTDGWLAFGTGSQTASENTPIPNNDNINSMVAVFWDDLYDEEFYFGKIFYHHDVTNHRFIVEWDSISHNNFISEPVKEVFQAILLDPAHHITLSGDGEIILQYKVVNQPESLTIGIENHTQNIGLQYFFNSNYDPTASPLVNQYAIKFTTQPPSVSTPVSVEGNLDNVINSNSSLKQNYPNPFSDITSINYSLVEPSFIKLDIFNITGELIRTLCSGKQPAGNYTVNWNGRNDYGAIVPPGIYIYRLQSNSSYESMRMIKFK
jgi:hypothetical protein